MLNSPECICYCTCIAIKRFKYTCWKGTEKLISSTILDRLTKCGEVIRSLPQVNEQIMKHFVRSHWHANALKFMYYVLFLWKPLCLNRKHHQGVNVIQNY